ncbi:hypothetical protein I4U23_013327 [Adineta vaga]|nr:hypothetical protein I4U23_013327 [Adineta vaga]
MKRRHHQRMTSGRDNHNMPSSLQRMMINDDHKYTIGLTQPMPLQPPSISSPSSSSVNHLQSSSLTIYDNNHHLQLTQKKSASSSRIRLGLRCLCSLDDKQQQPFEQIFSCNEQTTNISECIFEQYISRITTNYINTLIILSGQSCEIIQLQTTLISLTLIALHRFINEQNKSLLLRVSIQEFPSDNLTARGKFILLPSDYSIVCPIETSDYLKQLCIDHQSYPLLITFHLINRSSNKHCVQLHILSTNDNYAERANLEEFSNLLMSLSLSLPSNRQKQSFHSSNPRNSHEQSLFSLTSIFHEYVINIEEHFLYILATITNDKQLKSYSKIHRLLKLRRNQSKMSRDSTSIETVINRPHEEIWVDGPLSASHHKKEIWIDGPRQFVPCSPKISSNRSTPKHRSKPMHIKAKLSSYSPYDQEDHISSNNFDTESVVSSHCHLPVLPVFKDHSLLPFRSSQLPTKPKPLMITDSSKLNLKLSTNKLNDDLEMLEKTLETLLVPSPIVPHSPDCQSTMSKSLNRIDHLSSLMSTDEKTKRLSRIVSPTRFDKILSMDNSHPSVPNSPFIIPRTRRSRTSTKKPQIPLRTTSLAETTSRPSILQRLFGLRSSQQPQPTIVIQSPPSSPLISPLTVTLDSHDDLMPLTTSSTASSASGRASSSGYESMGNTILEEMLASMPTNITNANNSVKTRNKSIRKEDRRTNSNGSWNSPIISDKSTHQQRLIQLKHRQNELKLELAMTKTFLQNFERSEFLHHPTLPNSPMRKILSTNQEDEEDELERDIEYLERRLATAKSQLKSKQLIS